MARAIAPQMFAKSTLEIDGLADVAGFALTVWAMRCQRVYPVAFAAADIAHSLGCRLRWCVDVGLCVRESLANPK